MSHILPVLLNKIVLDGGGGHLGTSQRWHSVPGPSLLLPARSRPRHTIEGIDVGMLRRVHVLFFWFFIYLGLLLFLFLELLGLLS